jgi:hypothetical protein
MKKMTLGLSALLAYALITPSLAQLPDVSRETATKAVQSLGDAAVKKVKAKSKAKKENIDFNAPLSMGDDLSTGQIANPLFQNRMEAGCNLVSGKEIEAALDVGGGGMGGIYLLEANCGQKTKQYLYMAKPTTSNELNDIVFAELKTNANKNIYYQENTRRVFLSGGNNRALREIRWQELAKKSMSKSELKENAAVFSKQVPKGPVPVLPN